MEEGSVDLENFQAPLRMKRNLNIAAQEIAARSNDVSRLLAMQAEQRGSSCENGPVKES